MKITHIIIGLNVGGAETALKRLIVAHMSNPEYEHSVISLTDLGVIGAELQSMGVSVHSLGMVNALSMFKTFRRLRHKLRSSKPDIVQTWMYHADLLGGLAARSIGLRRLIWGIRTTEIKDGGSRFTLLIRKLCALLSSFIPAKIVCVAHAAQSVHEEVGYDVSKMLVISNGFPVTKLTIEPEEVEQVRQQAGIESWHRVVGSVGRFNSVKDQCNFIQAAGLLMSRYNDLRFLMVGRGLDRSNDILMEWINKTGRPEAFVLLGERSDVPACLAAIDIFCLHSRTEGFPNVVGEAMAMAKPCVVTNVGDAAYLVGNTGVVVPKEDSEALANGINELLILQPWQRDSLGRAAQMRVYNEFTTEHTRIKFEELYQSMCRSI